MSKHHSADEKLVSGSLRKNQVKPLARSPSDNSAPQIGKPRTNSKNQYR